MKSSLNEWQKNVVSSWPKIYNEGILKYDWPKVKEKFDNFDLEFNIPNDIKIALFSIHPTGIEKILHSRELTEWLGDCTIYELLTGTSKYDYTREEAENLVKLYIISYWSSMYK